jgi:hypothetical protein
VSDPSSILVRLIEAAERTACCRPVTDLNELGELVGELRSPVGAPLSRAPVVLMAVLMANRTGPLASWGVVAAALLPMLREDLTRVMEARRRPLEPDAGAYRGGHR